MPVVELNLTGADELKQLLTDLPPRLEKKYLRKGVRAAGNVIKGAVDAPEDTGALESSVKTRAFKRTRKNVVGVTVGYRRVERRPSRKAGEKKSHYRRRVKANKGQGEMVFYGLAVEYGRKGQAPQPALRDAFEQTEPRALGLITAAVRDCIQQAKA